MPETDKPAPPESSSAAVRAEGEPERQGLEDLESAYGRGRAFLLLDDIWQDDPRAVVALLTAALSDALDLCSKAEQERDALRKERERDDFLLRQAQPHVCSMLCPSTRRGDEPWAHHNLCEVLTERLRGILAESALATSRAEGLREAERRRFMQVRGRYLSWGIVGPCREAGVMFTDDDGFGPYRTFECYERYLDHGWGGGPVSDEVRDAAERAVIDNAIRYLTQPQPPEEGS